MFCVNNLAYQRIQGGFGNQLFQICAGIFLSEIRNKDKLCIDCNSNIFANNINCKKKYYKLKNICELILTEKYYKKIKFSNGLFSIINRIFTKLSFLFKKNYIDLPNNIYDFTFHTPISYSINGYFQNYKYVDEIINKEKFNEIYSIYKNSFPFYPKKNSVLIHFRYYPNDGFSIKESINPKFFRECLNNEIPKNINTIYISTDSQLSLKSILKILKMENLREYKIIDLRPLTENMEVDELIFFLSTFPTILLSNSTFSWWIGYFASIFKNSKVIAPTNKWLYKGYIHPWTDFPIKTDRFNWI